MLKRKRKYDLRRIKATWPYSVTEIIELLGVHKNTVFQWIKDGLMADKSKRLWLVRGDELARFLSARQASKKRKCRLTEFPCFKCHDRREAYLSLADIVIESSSKLRVKVVCAVCGTAMNKVQRVSDLQKIQDTFNIQELTGRHLIDCFNPSLNSDEGEKK